MIDFNSLLSEFAYHAEAPMLFHHGIFLFLFANFLILYAIFYTSSKVQKWILILFSFYFYFKSSGNYLLLLLVTVGVDYFFSILISKTTKPKLATFLTALAIVFSLSFLMYFKYLDFFLRSLGLGEQGLQTANIVLPIGISFYTFQSISYLVDIHRKVIKVPSLLDYLLYMSFFPHLVAGPIVRAKDFLPQLKKKIHVTREMVNEGFYLITKGFIKKAIIADFIAQYVDIIYASPTGASGIEAIFAVLGYALQIFCDFSGYTDMAIGIALLMGYRLCLNFDSPYKSLNITQFWRKWHISLSSWLRDFIYIPLGGNKKGFALQLVFLLVTMIIGGFWHGADWKFVWWGIGHGLLLVFHKLLSRWVNISGSKVWDSLSWILTFSAVVILWIPFRAVSLSDSLILFKALFQVIDLETLFIFCQQNSLYVFLLGIGFSMTLLNDGLKEKFKTWYYKESILIKLVLLVVLIQIMYEIQSSEVQPFIYFQF
jgi:D-alanyl-lipoteichoic acid acyltransferase DltB (MBOAT superfamily)